jgi:hypothetical protein
MAELRVGPIVRTIGPNHVAIWTEWTHPCEVTLQAVPANSEQDIKSFRSRTITVGKRHYAISGLTDLEAATWYTYQIVSTRQDGEQFLHSATDSLVQSFRTLDLPETGKALRLAYGSCRKQTLSQPDALSAFGSWLLHSVQERETSWPHLLLLIGDQIYADDYTGRSKRTQPLSQDDSPQKSSRSGAQTFTEFADLYEAAWTGDDGIRQVFAALPVYMIFDDHEVTNGWNISPTWRALALQRGLEQTLVDGLVAYWIYQGWGNICMQRAEDHPLVAIMQKAALRGEDALEDLRAWMRREVYEDTTLRWHYQIPTAPPIFVADVRADRPAILNGVTSCDAPARIMSREQMTELRIWMREQDSTDVLLVSSVPVLLTPFIGFAEYLTAIRPLQHVPFRPLRRLGSYVAGLQQKLALSMSFDHWQVFAETWREFVKLLAAHKHDIVVLSGDVHFSYSIEARRGFFLSRRHASVYQLVASPFNNVLERRDRRLIVAQAWIKRMAYGGLRMRMLPLVRPGETKRGSSDLLLQNTIALVTFQPKGTQENSGGYTIQQIYLGVKDGMLQEIASTSVPR